MSRHPPTTAGASKILPQAPGAKGAFHDVRGAAHGVRVTAHGVRGAAHGVRGAAHGVRRAAHGVRGRGRVICICLPGGIGMTCPKG